jgi:hypothetical protein
LVVQGCECAAGGALGLNRQSNDVAFGDEADIWKFVGNVR